MALGAAEHRHLLESSKRMRMMAIEMVHRSKSAHLGSALSMIDLLAVLYGRFLRIDPKAPAAPDRDRFILSKGHGASGLYAALAERGILPKGATEHYGADGGILGVHPSSLLTPGVEASTGSLGHGLPIGAGMALAARADKSDCRTVVLISDGECDEGATWEAVLFAAHQKLASLLCVVDYNKIQSFGRVSEVMELEPFAEKWRAFGWAVREVDGHDHAAIAEALDGFPFAPDRPSCLIAHTVKGKGYPGLEDTVASHYMTPTPEQMAQARSALSCDA